jgi:hypothetical protein
MAEPLTAEAAIPVRMRWEMPTRLIARETAGIELSQSSEVRSAERSSKTADVTGRERQPEGSTQDWLPLS